MNRRSFFASLLSAAVGPPAAARPLAQPPFICAPGQITEADWTAANAQPLVFHPASFVFVSGEPPRIEWSIRQDPERWL